MKNKRRIIGILAAVILATIGTVALVGYVQSAKDKAVAQEALVDVYVVDKIVPKGAPADTIRTSISVEQVPARLEQPGAIADLKELDGNVAATDLQPGDQLLAARLVPKEQVSEDVKDKVQVSAMFTPERAVGGTVKKGDLIGVYLSFDPFSYDEAGRSTDLADANTVAGAATVADSADPTTAQELMGATPAPSASEQMTPKVTRLEFQHVLVTNVQTTNEPVVPDENAQKDGVEQISASQYIVTVALSPEQSERFVFATEFGHLWLSSDPATVSDDGTRLVTLGNVYSVVK